MHRLVWVNNKMKKFPSLESEDQEAIFEWAKTMEYLYPELELLQGSMQGVKLNIGQAVKAKKQGMKKGFPDIYLPVKNKTYSALCLELKRESGGKVSETQKRCLKLLAKYGNYACVCKGRESAIKVIMDYLENKL
jgi:hypothetical protein